MKLLFVINFFSSSKYLKIWEKLFKNLKKETNTYCNSINTSSKIQLQDILFQENIHYLIEILHLKKIYSSLSDKEIQKKIVNELDTFVYPKLNIQFDIHEIFDFCSEIKKFYVIITRPKTFLVFYETNLNIGRQSFYEFMKSEEINIIVEEDNLHNTEPEFLNNVLDYFNKIDLRVKSRDELRILGNNEFNEGHYSRAIYFYRTSRHYLLALISEVFYNEGIINEKINSSEKNNSELILLNEDIINNINKIINQHDKKNLYTIIEKDDNRINITNILQQIIDFLGKSLVFLKRYDEAINISL